MTPERLLAITASVVIIVAIVGGFFLIEGPGRARTEKFDEDRVNDLNALSQLIDEHFRVNGSMPDDLGPFEGGYNFDQISNDPRTGEAYGYERVTDASYRLCATFETDEPHRFGYYPRAMPTGLGEERHVDPTVIEGAGRQCFEISILKSN